MKNLLTAILFFILCGFAAEDFYAQPSPSAPSAKMTAAAELYKQQKFPEAATAFGDVLKDEPNNHRAWYLLGMALHSTGKFEPAIKAFEKSVALTQNPNAMYNIACGYARLGKTEQAFEWLEKSISAGVAPFVNLETDKDLESLRTDARFKNLAQLAERRKKPCMFLAEARQFDFWVGEWDVFNPTGQKVGTNSIQLFANGCGVLENWTSAAGSDGKSLNYYDARTQKWHQYWIGTDGGALRYAGNFNENAMRFAGEAVANGRKTLQKLTFFKLDENTVRQLAESSADDGATWTVNYDFKYVRKK